MAQTLPLRFSLRQLLICIAVLGSAIALWCAWPVISDSLWTPKDGSEFHNRAVRRTRRGDVSGAIQDLNKAIDLEPQSDRHYRERGDVYFNEHQVTKAIADYETAIRLSRGEPASVYALNDYATALASIGRYRDAIKACTEVIAIKDVIRGQPAVAFENRGVSYSELGEYDDAIRDLSQAIKLMPDEASFYYNRGSVYYQKDDRDRAEEDLRRARELDPRFAKSTYEKKK
jgi:tetratricopeptide (TPR) repeat protein